MRRNAVTRRRMAVLMQFGGPRNRVFRVVTKRSSKSAMVDKNLPYKNHLAMAAGTVK
jgi:hypothetical protein